MSTGNTHVCDKNCDQKIAYDNHSSVCLVSHIVSPLTDAEQEVVRSFRRKREEESLFDTCSRRTKHMYRCDAVSMAVPSSGTIFRGDGLLSDRV